jgi:hypothetical protein
LRREVSNYFQAVGWLGRSGLWTWIVPFPKVSHDLENWITIMNGNYVSPIAFTLMHDGHEQSGCYSEWKFMAKEHPHNLQTPAEIEEKHATLNALLQLGYRNTIREFV